ncbi:hypothetical protein MHC_01340 [Mycoplasma haemocanis str. Illinois]|uniref:Uncharacterized protein n=1 Tax=Mycoplasma haemocanis (strain Illinois) TaxID=1111676 RepID=H6N662_MYCHN|nr:hypothetical protein [Mycoplasma haemocanis]AEW45134.1 hypothetical protein MHC_01340 [Mycoplasma haemocanis str. Illinois]
MGFLSSKAILGLVGGATVVSVGGGYFLFSNGKSLFKKKTGSFCVTPAPHQGSFGGCLITFKEEGKFKEYLESQGKSSYNKEATGLEEALSKARKAYESGLTAFVYLDSGSQGSGAKWVFPDNLQEAWRKANPS